MWALWRARLSRFDLMFEAVFIGVMVAAYAAFLWMLPPADVLVVLTAKTELATFKVADVEKATFRVSGMRMDAGNGTSDCKSGIVTPGLGSRVEYRRGSADFFNISIDLPNGGTAPGDFTEDVTATPVQMPASVVFSSKTCAAAPAAIYPLAGPVEFGAGRPGQLAGNGAIDPSAFGGGTVSVFARAHSRLLGISFPRLIYRVTSFDLPPGSRLSTLSRNEGKDGPIWLGSLRIGASQDGFIVEASTTARQIRLELPGTASSSNSEGSLIDIGSYPQFLNDPNLIVLQFVWGGLLALIHFTRPVLAKLRARGDEP